MFKALARFFGGGHNQATSGNLLNEVESLLFSPGELEVVRRAESRTMQHIRARHQMEADAEEFIQKGLYACTRIKRNAVEIELMQSEQMLQAARDYYSGRTTTPPKPHSAPTLESASKQFEDARFEILRAARRMFGREAADAVWNRKFGYNDAPYL